MNAFRTIGGAARILPTIILLSGPGAVTVAEPSSQNGASPNLVLWDSGAPIPGTLAPGDRAGWKLVPNDLLFLEKDPPKASSDPGYYGRDYSFQGDAVVETPSAMAVFRSAKGCVTIYARQAASGAIGSNVVELTPVRSQEVSTIVRSEVIRNAGDEIVLRVSFSSGSAEAAGLFSFDKTGVIEVKPDKNMNEVRLSSPIEYGIVPTFIGDDLIFGGSERAVTNTFAIPSESMFLGLLQGQDAELVVTWPKAKQRVRLNAEEQNHSSGINAVDFNNAGQSFYLAVLSAPGIWHKEVLSADYLEKDVSVHWKRPFPARWKTQLYEEELKTTFAFRPTRGDVWRGVAGSYIYPAWFNGEEANYHLSKKVQPKGESLIYCLEGLDTPAGILTPADVLKQTLGRPEAESILDFAGRQLRTHHRRGGLGVRRACTCGCTEAIQAIFESHEEAARKDDIQGELDDMIYFVHCHVERINEYRQFADSLLKWIQEKRSSSPQCKTFLHGIEEIARQIPDEVEVQKENMKNFTYADELSARTMALTAKEDPGNLKAYMELLKAWRAMGGAQDYVLAKCHIVARTVFQESGYASAGVPDAVPLAEEIRSRCRQTLRHPDGYEVWADY